MLNYSPDQLRLVRQLLHDAMLQEATWDRTLGTFTARFNCLRRDVSGSELSDRVVEFRLTGAQVVAVGYDSSDFAARPSDFEPPRRITVADLSDWPFRPQEATLWINSAMSDDALTSARLDWLGGDEKDLRDASCTFCITFDQWRDFGLPILRVRLLVGGDSFAIVSGGVPLGLDEWTKQFEAWWKGWEIYWDEQYKDRQQDEPDERAAFIPAGQSESPDRSYQPPKEPVFALEPSDAPSEIVRPIRDWFESHHEQHWLRMAHAYPHPDQSATNRAEQLGQWNTGDDFGRWGYARAIDEWWLEGQRACVIIRGIEHLMPCEGRPAENGETVWTFALRRREGIWTIDIYSQGWPAFRSAKKLDRKRKPWLKSWASGDIT